MNMKISPIGRGELFQAQLVLFVAIGLQIAVSLISEHLTFGPQYLIIATEIALAVSLGLTTSNHGKFRRSASIVLLGIISLANISSFVLVAQSLINGTQQITGYELLVSAVAIFLTNIIVFALWYWEIDSPGLTGSKWSKHDKDFQFTQQDLEKDFPYWQPKFIDYLYLSSTNAINFAAADAKPLTHQAKGLMGTQALISAFTLALVVARSVNILG
ncbi:hypothetical protein HZB74_02785 [Candidatus Saccharibacteria bacterium]|nr:hypothetical protein [Candidatus Saccharibacteria bacterium]